MASDGFSSDEGTSAAGWAESFRGAYVPKGFGKWHVAIGAAVLVLLVVLIVVGVKFLRKEKVKKEEPEQTEEAPRYTGDTENVINSVNVIAGKLNLDQDAREKLSGIYRGFDRIDMNTEEAKAFASQCKNQIYTAPCKRSISHKALNAYNLIKRSQKYQLAFLLGATIAAGLGVAYVYPNQSRLMRCVYTVFIISLLYACFKTLYRSYIVNKSAEVFTMRIYDNEYIENLRDGLEEHASVRDDVSYREALERINHLQAALLDAEGKNIKRDGAISIKKPTKDNPNETEEMLYENALRELLALSAGAARYRFDKSIETYYGNVLSVFF